MTDKSADAFRTISEVADELDLPQHVLRFWETRFQQIKPMKRGGGRRYYRPDDVELLRGIRYLLYVKGFTIKGVQRILRENGPRFVVAIGTGDMAALAQIQAGRTPAAAAPAAQAPQPPL
ncbi:MAG: MerR family transcriptional regulator, partial [Aurantimonas coralicida]